MLLAKRVLEDERGRLVQALSQLASQEEQLKQQLAVNRQQSGEFQRRRSEIDAAIEELQAGDATETDVQEAE